MIAESERMLTENNMDETFLNASITFEVWYFGLGEPTGFMKFFVDHTEPNDRHFSGGNEVWFDCFEGVRVPKGSYQKQSNNRSSKTNDGNQDQEENDTATASVATLENVRNAVLSVCGMDFRIEDDVLVASSGILTTIRNILLEDDDGTMSSTCLALLRL